MKKSIEEVLKDTRIVLDIIQKTELTEEEKVWISESAVSNFNDYVNPGFLKYRKSVSNDYTAIGFEVARGLFDRGVLVAGTMLNARVIRIEPPLTIPHDDVSRVLEILHETLLEVQAGRGNQA